MNAGVKALREIQPEEQRNVEGGFFWGVLVAVINGAGKLGGKGKELEAEDRLGNFEIQG